MARGLFCRALRSTKMQLVVKLLAGLGGEANMAEVDRVYWEIVP